MIDRINDVNAINRQTAADISSVYGGIDTGRPPQKPQKSEKTGEVSDQSVKVSLSEEALRKAGMLPEEQGVQRTQKTNPDQGLSSAELKELAALKSRDREVRAHEMAHVSAGGSLVRKGASYQYEMGPDGVRYAVGGEVSIDTSPVQDDPAATIRKMQQVKRAALAPAEPSSQDRSVASAASQMEAQARSELLQQTSEANPDSQE